MSSVPTGGVVVVVPAHNEQDGIGACMAGIQRAAAHPQLTGVRIELVVVLDACTDATSHRAAAALASLEGDMGATVLSVSFRNVGQTRALGVAHGFETLGPVDPQTVWLATTDADSVVPTDWLVHHLELRRRGADGCAGMVIVDSWGEHTPATRAAYERRYWPRGRLDFEHPHVHGTNLGVSMAAYLDAGGFPGLKTGEDHALWRALLAAGRRLVATPLAPVVTSGRRRGRSPAGFADLLSSIESVHLAGQNSRTLAGAWPGSHIPDGPFELAR